MQIEFAGVPETCQNCEAGFRFIEFMNSDEAQKIIMTKNYMLPVSSVAKETTEFDTLKIYKLIDFKMPNKEEIQRWINLWVEIRKNEG